MNRLDAIRQRVEAATPGEWSVSEWEDGGVTIDHHDDLNDEPVTVAIMAAETTDADAIFIAHARQDLPDLLAVVEAARLLMEWTPSNAIPVERLRAALVPLLEEAP